MICYLLNMGYASRYSSTMITPEDFPKIHLAIATPCYGGQVFQHYYMSVLKFSFAAIRSNLNVSYLVRGGDSLIPRIRNSIVAEFLSNPTYTHLLWIDADIGFEPDQIFRLIMTDRDVCGGVYPLKRIAWPAEGVPAGTTEEQFNDRYTHYPFNPVPGKSPDKEGFIEVLDLPTGMMLIKREVLLKMIEAYPNLQYKADFMLGLENIADQIDNFHYRFFDVMTEENGRYLSEDYAFCRRWQAIGGTVWADIQSKLSHTGSHVYQGNFLKGLEARGAIRSIPAETETKLVALPPPGDDVPVPMDAPDE